jgi:hypothetical protein
MACWIPGPWVKKSKPQPTSTVEATQPKRKGRPKATPTPDKTPAPTTT